MEVIGVTHCERGRHRHGHLAGVGSRVCSFWLQGRCTRNPCRFLHAEPPSQQNGVRHHRHHREVKPSGSSLPKSEGTSKVSKGKDDGLKPLRQDLSSGSCVEGGNPQFEQSWSGGEGFGLLAKLEGHAKGIAGIGLPAGSDKLYTASKDGTVRIWDCNTGRCSDTASMGGEVGSFICEGPWVFVGLQDAIKAWNTENGAAFVLEVSSGLVYSMAVDNNLLFAGCENGDILVYRGTSLTSPPQLVATLKGHTSAVVSSVTGANQLYSGSADRTIKVWDTHTFECITTLKGHTDVVMSVLCWDQFLLSCSLDRTIKVWAAASTGGRDLEVVYTHNEDHRILALNGMHDMEGKPILLCSCNNDTVRLYELPMFVERGRIYSQSQVLALQVAPESGLFFTGDGAGTLNVWKWSGERKQEML